MVAFVKDGLTSWKRTKNIYIKDANTWKRAKRVWEKINGTWTIVHPYPAWSVPTTTVSATGITDVAIPMIDSTYYADNFLVTHNGGWGQSGEDGAIMLLSPSLGTILDMREGHAIIVPVGYSLYSVSISNVETLLTGTFPNQKQNVHNTYLEVQWVQTQNAFFRSDGAPANVSNPTTFKHVNMASDFDRTSILAGMGTYDRYYVLRK